MSKRQIIKERRKRRAIANRILTILGILAIIGLIATFFILNNKPAVPSRKIVNGLTAGDPNAPIQVIEYADFQCVACQYAFTVLEPEIVSKYINTGKVFFTFEPFSFLGPESYRAAEAGYCAADQGRFWEFHDTLFENWAGENQGTFSDSNLLRFASKIDMNHNTFTECFNSGKYVQKVLDKSEEIRNLGITQTPTYIVNGQKVTTSMLLDTLAALANQ